MRCSSSVNFLHLTVLSDISTKNAHLFKPLLVIHFQHEVGKKPGLGMLKGLTVVFIELLKTTELK